jgi:azurin
MLLLRAAALLALSGLAPGATPALPQAPPRLVVVTATDDMKFSVTEIRARPGETLRIRLAGAGTAPKSAMAHNLIVLRPGTNQIEFVDAAARAKATDYIPPKLKGQVLAATTLIGNGEAGEVVITLPARAGTYPFLCSFPGHFINGARGIIVAK